MNKEKRKEIVLDVPLHIKPFRNNKESVSIDYEIEDVIKHLWNNKICTLGCCSGHEKYKPSIIIANSYNSTEIKKIYALINEVDTRDWEIFQWRL